MKQQVIKKAISVSTCLLLLVAIIAMPVSANTLRKIDHVKATEESTYLWYTGAPDEEYELIVNGTDKVSKDVAGTPHDFFYAGFDNAIKVTDYSWLWVEYSIPITLEVGEGYNITFPINYFADSEIDHRSIDYVLQMFDEDGYSYHGDIKSNNVKAYYGDMGIEHYQGEIVFEGINEEESPIVLITIQFIMDDFTSLGSGHHGFMFGFYDDITVTTGDMIGEQDHIEDEAGGYAEDVQNMLPIPDTGNIIGAMSNLVGAFSVDDTKGAVLTIPRVAIPAIDGVFEEIPLLEEQKVDFNDYVEMIPEAIVTLVRNLLSCALVIYCIKEIYDVIYIILAYKKDGGGA